MMRAFFVGAIILGAAFTNDEVVQAQQLAPLAATPQPASSSEVLSPIQLEYYLRRHRMRDVSGAHYGLGLWCEQKGLALEATAHFMKAIHLDPDHEGAWRSLGFTRYRGRWVAKKRLASWTAENLAQKQADGRWEPQLRKWKSGLGTHARHAQAVTALTDVTDPRAVPSIWKVFVASRDPDHRQAALLFGQVQCAAASQKLALLAVFSRSAEVRRIAVETLRRRELRDYAGTLISLLRKPVKYQVRPVEGPGLPGVLTVQGRDFDIERSYVSPPPPDFSLTIFEPLNQRGGALPTIKCHTDSTSLPFAWIREGYTFSSRCIIPPHVPVIVDVGKMWVENWKSALSAQQQLLEDIDTINHFNDSQHSYNQVIVNTLNQATGQQLPADRATWTAWWFAMLGRTNTPPLREPFRPTITEIVSPYYLPQDVGGLGFDPTSGYYLRVPAG